jgi:hypothetical protein
VTAVLVGSGITRASRLWAADVAKVSVIVLMTSGMALFGALVGMLFAGTTLITLRLLGASPNSAVSSFKLRD